MFNRYFFSRLSEGLKANPDEFVRAKILISLLLFDILFATLFTIVSLFSNDISNHMKVMSLGYSVSAIVLYMLMIVVYIRTEAFSLISNLMLTIITFGLFFGIHVTGGFAVSPLMQFVVSGAVMAFILNGVRNGLLWLGIIFVSSLFSMYATKNGWIVGSELPKHLLFISYNIMYFLVVAMVCSILYIYELTNIKLHKNLLVERNQFKSDAAHDPLTGAPNRSEFFRRINALCADKDRRSRKFALAYIDLDGFKPVNDQFGHVAGDHVLITLVDRLQKTLRQTDTLARLGGDEFAVIISDIESDKEVMKVVNKLLTVIKQPIEFDNNSLHITASIGVAYYPDHSRNAEALCRMADKAMYVAKELGGRAVSYADIARPELHVMNQEVS